MMKTKEKLPHNFWKNPIHFLALGFGSGLSPIMPGTCGTIIAIPIYLLLVNLSLPFYILSVSIITITGIWICDAANRKTKIKDHPAIVWDEIAGYLITMIGAPNKITWIILGFILFRVFDIWKPWPINWIDKNTRGGFGIMADDILAAIYAGIILQLIIFSCG